MIITQLDVYWIVPISKTTKLLLMKIDLSKQEKVDADPKAI